KSTTNRSQHAGYHILQNAKYPTDQLSNMTEDIPPLTAIITSARIGDIIRRYSSQQIHRAARPNRQWKRHVRIQIEHRVGIRAEHIMQNGIQQRRKQWLEQSIRQRIH